MQCVSTNYTFKFSYTVNVQNDTGTTAFLSTRELTSYNLTKTASEAHHKYTNPKRTGYRIHWPKGGQCPTGHVTCCQTWSVGQCAGTPSVHTCGSLSHQVTRLAVQGTPQCSMRHACCMYVCNLICMCCQLGNPYYPPFMYLFIFV